jgi:hypothetical protein
MDGFMERKFKKGDKVAYFGGSVYFENNRIYTVLGIVRWHDEVVQLDIKKTAPVFAMSDEVRKLYRDTKLARKMLGDVKVFRKGWIYVQ